SSKFKMVTVLFADIQGFTKIAEQMNPEKLIDELDRFYFHFDSVVEKYNIEKIKTIGDAYMAAGGLPVSKDESTKNTVLAALEMAEFIAKRRKEREASGLIPFEMRLGIHTGSVVAGIVGQKKFQYDIWGDTVNTASRMENAGEAGKVNISQSTYELIKDDVFTFESRGEIETKGKGKIEMWFVGKVI
ncbi:MAG: adenylate/guanylate cyclase domain-containing protein, partial [Bacteroidales bacterium]|nr:adenylate/guanylate cyclase domain-containing protein [Bacteroidales bacterium]